MEFFEAVKRRQSIRAYQPKPVEEEKLRAILDAVRSAPSAGNFQAYAVYVVRKADQMKALSEATFDQKFIAAAPLSLVFCRDRSRCEYEPRGYYALQDASIAATMAMLATTASGLGACWVGAFAPEKVSSVLGIPAEHDPIAILSLGYGAETPERTPRRSLEEFVHEL